MYNKNCYDFGSGNFHIRQKVSSLGSGFADQFAHLVPKISCDLQQEAFYGLLMVAL